MKPANQVLIEFLKRQGSSIEEFEKELKILRNELIEEFEETQARRKDARPNVLVAAEGKNNSIELLHYQLREFIKNWFTERKIHDIDILDFSITGIQNMIDDNAVKDVNTDSKLSVNKYVGFEKRTTDYLESVL